MTLIMAQWSKSIYAQFLGFDVYILSWYEQQDFLLI